MDIKTVQRELVAKGYNVEVDGEVGPQTMRAVSDRLVFCAVPNSARWGSARKVTAIKQQILTQLGMYSGEIDGLVGPNTQYAIEQWQDHVRGTPDPDPLPKVLTPWPRQASVPSFYGTVGTAQHMLTLPFPMRLSWDLGKEVKRISLHQKVHDSAGRAFARIHEHYGHERIKELRLDRFGGSLNVRLMRGGSTYSMHSWGIAIDFDPDRNQLRWGSDKATMARPEYNEFWDAWYAEGWIGLGRERNYDWMHVQAARL